MFEDHWVCEYWNDEADRWVLADAQLDERQQRLSGIDFDTLDVPRDGFVVAGQARAQCRSGEADPASFGLSGLKASGDDRLRMAGTVFNAVLNRTEDIT
jgi:hypothetical protein